MARNRSRARRGSPLNLPGAFELWRPSKELVLNNIWIFGPLYAVLLIFDLHSWLWSPPPPSGHHWVDHFDSFSSGWAFAPSGAYGIAAFIGFSILWLLFVLAVGTVAQIMSQAAQLDAVEHKPLDFQILWNLAKDRWWDMLRTYVVLVITIMVGLCLLVIPGLIFLRRYFLTPYVMLESKKGTSVFAAMDKSSKLAALNTGSIWGIIGVMFLIALTGVIPFIGGLVSFALGSLYSVAPALRYQQLKKLAA